jgi:transposase
MGQREDQRKVKLQSRREALTMRQRLRVELSVAELEGILEHARRGALSDEEFATLKGAMETLAFLTQELEKKSVSVARLKELLFGATTETTAQVIKKVLEQVGGNPASPSATEPGQVGHGAPENSPGQSESGVDGPAKGHGRNGAAAYTGVKRVKVAIGKLQAGDSCPKCAKGKVYASCEPGLLVRLTGQAPVGGAVYELEKLRCSLCGEMFSAEAPAGIGQAKYDAPSAAMIGLLKYGAGVPFYRLERLQEGLGIPLPAATQWEIVAQSAAVLAPAHGELIHQAAQGQVLHNDDTTMKVLALGDAAKEPVDAQGATDTREDAAAPQAARAHQAAGARPAGEPADVAEQSPPPTGAQTTQAGERKGVFTSGIVSKTGDHRIALFFTGHKHAGENLLDLLQQRSSELGPPIQMCDALSRNMPKELETILANCLAHGRRKFVEVAGSFPEECIYVLKVFRDVYHNDALAREHGMSPQERLTFHQTHSGPRMAELEAWMATQIEERKVEPNSSLGEAIAYLRKHWNELTLFLRVANAPLDNNICERALKKAILHRKNSYFYRTANGARVGDLFMSLIHTCELNHANPFEYLTALQEHAGELAAAPAQWMPWNYRATFQSSQGRPAG